ncbi:hypothetical protein PAPYR_3528 [Paratrimastix pyriformis]|uniref:Par3/HAL N-terminal domain-containing protein n=1 Tax=Paratrimastix pyriformis TaxID=342808 RepID=A0ABQ8UPS8_9EUKA|nr:hypothetical protein PAPYR_3528 [Paratrimastix pyriformis]
MKVFVHVKEKTIMVQCGPGNQRIKWLGDVGVARYDSSNGLELGNPKGIRLEDGTRLDMTSQVQTVLPDESHVWVILRGKGQHFGGA